MRCIQGKTMCKNNLFFKIMNNKEKIIIFCCFWGMLCFNILNACLSTYFIFTYDGGIHDPKSYYEIRTVEMAREIFLQNIFKNWLYGLMFYFPPVWSYFFTKRLNFNAILIQMLPLLIIIGAALFS